MDGSAPSRCRPPATTAELEMEEAATQRSVRLPTLWLSCLNAVHNQCNPISLHKFIRTVVSVHNDVCLDLSDN